MANMVNDPAGEGDPSDVVAYQWPEWVPEPLTETIPREARVVPWSFIADGDMTAQETHDFAMWVGSGWTCAGCLAEPTWDDPSGTGPWPSLSHAPNGMRVVLTHGRPDPLRRPSCPRRK